MPELTIELVPKTCWGSNVRDHTTRDQWDIIRKEMYRRANYRCEICGDTGKNQGLKHDVECHEVWHYNDKHKRQTLVGLIALCPRCHEVKHYGRAVAIGKDIRARMHLKKVNDNWQWKDIFAHIDKEFAIYRERSKHNWILDMDFINREFGLKLYIKRELNESFY